MKLIPRVGATLLVSFLLGCSSPAPKSKETPESAPEKSVESSRALGIESAKGGQNNLRIPYPNREVAVRTSDGKIAHFISDDQGLIRLPDGDFFDPSKLEILVCRSLTGCSAPTF
ncbi:hypothetical protein J2W28_000615 [Variovorax boronicumulans]|uniref:hypothetical protein n=1 Tax=Variovorax boronicumulans TaxID=436515 RepID=UPI00278123C0|nr:hypothetical protein [Variovorax boronicumulans]MDP9990005.1 hypothetical protein [Variovorax boronicumulans]MDQ0001487.1 hypothetical protein [Variovorax boronicumulans]